MENKKKATWIILGMALFEGSFVFVALMRDPLGILRLLDLLQVRDMRP